MAINLKHDAIIVFDLDDTLYHEIDFLKSAYHQITNFIVSHGFNSPYEEMLSLYKEGRPPFQALIQKYNYPFTADQFIDIYRNHIPDIKLKPDAASFLEKINKAGIITGLITDGRSITQRNKLKALGIEKYFSDIIISEEFGSAKPAVENYQYFMDKYPDKKYYYIGNDPDKDFIAPNKLGWTTVCIAYQDSHIHKPSSSLTEKHLPHYMINSFEEIIRRWKI